MTARSAGAKPGEPHPALSPLLRWAGGKRWLAKTIAHLGEALAPSMYLEPFVGGGAVFFASQWQRAVLGDSNRQLIRCYQGLAEDPALVRRKLARLPVDAAAFRRVSAWQPASLTGAAARLIYLNRTAYGGIYRENATGAFNVPFAGDRDLSTVLRDQRIEKAGAALARADLVHADFESLLDRVIPGALVYCDPPYSLPGAERGFRRYSGSPFEWKDQLRLADVLKQLATAGVAIVLSNSADEAVRALYPDAQVLPLTRKSTLARGAATEHKEAIYAMHADSATADSMIKTIASGVG